MYRRLLLLIILIWAGIVVAGTDPARADTIYGNGAYSACGAQSACAPTATTAPSQFRYSVNLQNGQTITSNPYELIVTPLNDSSSGITLTRVVIVVDGVPTDTFYPDDTGGIRRNWQTPPTGSHTIEVHVYTSHDDQPVIQRFTLTFAPAPTATNSTASPSPAATPSDPPNTPSLNIFSAPIAALTHITQAVTEEATRIIRQLPKPIVVSFPYLLLAALAGGLIFAFWQTRQEIAHAVALNTLSKHQQLLATDKTTLIQLLTHYLRTPLTLLEGALENGVLLHEIDPATATKLKNPFQSLHGDIEALIAHTASQITPTQTPIPAMPAKRPWLQPVFFLPPLLIGIILLALNALTVASGVLNQNLINNLTQIMLVTLGAMVWYIILRGRAIHRQERAELAAQTTERIRIDEIKNQLIQQASALLTAKAGTLRQQISMLNPTGKCAGQLLDACERLDKLNRAFSLASELKTGHAMEAPVVTSLAPILQASIATFDAPSQQSIKLDPSVDQTIAIRHPRWLQYVCIALLDNALAYSHPGQPIAISLQVAQEDIRLSITDHGRGIPPEYLEHIFTPFARAEGGLNFDHAGLGFSLFLNKLIMTYLGGDITIQSRLNEGTTVKLQLPAL